MKGLIAIQDRKVLPANLGDFMRSRGVELNELRLDQGQDWPREHYDFLAVLGGRMGPFQPERFTWMDPLKRLMAQWTHEGRPILSICLGAQLLAQALGSKLGPAAIPEVGWRSMELTEAGQGDPVLAGVEGSFPVLEWHKNTFSIPEGASHLAISADCPSQAFVMKRAYGFQPHLEATAELLDTWYLSREQRDEIAPGFETHGPRMTGQAEKIFANFLSLAAGAAGQRG